MIIMAKMCHGHYINQDHHDHQGHEGKKDQHGHKSNKDHHQGHLIIRVIKNIKGFLVIMFIRVIFKLTFKLTTTDDFIFIDRIICSCVND